MAASGLGIFGWAPGSSTQGELELFTTGGIGTATHGLVGVCGTGPTCSVPIYNSSATTLYTQISNSGGTQIAGVDTNGNLNTTTAQYASAAPTGAGFTVGPFTNTAGYNYVSFDFGALAPSTAFSSGSLQVSEDDGTGLYNFQPPCYSSVAGSAAGGGATTTGNLDSANSFGGSITWTCALGHEAVKLVGVAGGANIMALPIHVTFGVGESGFSSANATYALGNITNNLGGGAEKVLDSIPKANTQVSFTIGGDNLSHSTGIASTTQSQFGPYAPIQCMKNAPVNLTGTSLTQIIAASTAAAGGSIFVCGYVLSVSGGSVAVSYGNGTNCGMNSSGVISTLYAGNWTVNAAPGVVFTPAQASNLDALCMQGSATAVTVTGNLFYAVL